MEDIPMLWKLLNQKFTDTGLARGVFSAPGRVNLIGEHTDYNEGFVLPIAIGKKIMMLAQLRKDRLVQVFDAIGKSEVQFSLDDLNPLNKETWARYLMGVADEMQKAGYLMQGANIIFTSNIPQRVGLSSSAALEVATALTMSKLNRLEMNPLEMAHICRRAENNFVGVACGIMDQYVSCLGKKNHALFIDCRTNDYRLIPFKDNHYQIVICNSGIQRGLIDSEYNKRRTECEEATAFLNNKSNRRIKALRDVSMAELEKYKTRLPKVIFKRAGHVISENHRTQLAINALSGDDYTAFGRLMIESHQSLKDNYEVSCDELDILVESALKQKGVLGARMTGAGFGGCTVNLVQKEFINAFKKKMKQEYEKKTGIIPEIFMTPPAEGAEVIAFIK